MSQHGRQGRAETRAGVKMQPKGGDGCFCVRLFIGLAETQYQTAPISHGCRVSLGHMLPAMGNLVTEGSCGKEGRDHGGKHKLTRVLCARPRQEGLSSA